MNSKPPRRKIVKLSRAYDLGWWKIELSCGHEQDIFDPSEFEKARKTTYCGDCGRGYCKAGQHHIVDAQGPESAAFKCTKCPYKSE